MTADEIPELIRVELLSEYYETQWMLAYSDPGRRLARFHDRCVHTILQRYVDALGAGVDPETALTVCRSFHGVSRMDRYQVFDDMGVRQSCETATEDIKSGRLVVGRAGRRSDFEDVVENERGREPTLPEPWPYGATEKHEDCCLLFDGSSYCDCRASAQDELGWGECL